MSDIGSDVEDFEKSEKSETQSRRRKPTAEADGGTEAGTITEGTSKKLKIHDMFDETTVVGGGGGEGENDGVGEPRRGEEPVSSFERPDHVLHCSEERMHVKTMNVKDICSIITGCCAMPGVEGVLVTFGLEGLEFYARPDRSAPLLAHAFYHKANFSKYQVTKKISRVVPKTELDDLKKRIAKDVEFLEISDGVDGFVAGGRRTYNTGGGCDFTINLSSMEESSVCIVDLSSVRWNMQVRTASKHFSDNISFFDEHVKWIELAVSSKLLAFNGLREAGTTSKSINQTISSDFQGQYKACFNRKNLKSVTSARDINRTLCISFNITTFDFPIHFMYEMGQEQPQSHFSVYVAPSNVAE